ncbi:HEAT repeat domain-containing protein [Streptomyces sp. AcE210]|uniref:HEAT repeat domain-containing protein n=1 Tax=Streptomyces sp. AcE210 TaxID=2292703 RepID=UPI0019D1A437|nr:HEAT repeat domain-containing protein [Streptomyces sp. AcE210]
MAMFVHLTPQANAARIRRAGIRAAGRRHDGGRGVFCFPVLPSYTLTHQWLRELARHGGPRGLVAVQVRLPDDEPVTVGRYNRDPLATTAGDAVRRLAAMDDPRGWEVFVPRAVAKREVQRVRAVRQVTGWRYFPDAHGVVPCTCAGCRVRGEYGSRRLRERRPHPHDGPPPPAPALLRRVEAAGDPGDVTTLCEALHWFGLRRRGPVERLSRLADHPDPAVREALADAVAGWSTPGVDALLDRLVADPDPDVRELAAAVVERREERRAHR